MTISECADKAVYLKQYGGHNCCQAVTAALAEMLGLPGDDLIKLASGFCVGMGNMEATCGALIGAGMIAGLITGGAGTVRYTRRISEKFRERCGGSITCRELKGIDTGKVLCPCDECVRNAVLAYNDIFGE